MFMKRFIIRIFLASFIIFTPLTAQLKIGFNGGISISNVVFNPKTEATTLSSRDGIMIGVIADIPLTKNLFLQPGINYIQKGFEYENINFLNEKDIITAQHDFLSIPISLRYIFMPKSTLSPFLSLSPDLGIKLRYKTECDGEEYDLDPDGDKFESFNFSLSFGGGLNYMLDSKQDLFILFQYSLGLTDLSKTHSGETTHYTNKLNGMQILIGIKFIVQ
jgi:hypothetical protein